jgi:hypothetical protein
LTPVFLYIQNFWEIQQLPIVANMSVSNRSSFESLRSTSPAPSLRSEPDLCPPALSGPMVWMGKSMTPNKYVIELSSAEVENVRAAVVGFKRKA